MDTLYVFARAPVAGQVKTRLARVIGPEAAALLHAAFVEDVCALVRETADRRVLSVAGDPAHPVLRAIAERTGMEIAAQGEGDLGARMDAAIARALAEGEARVAIVGTDSPALPPRLVSEAFAALAEAEVVIGPAEDGGYWLVGARQPVPWLFEDIAWGTATVFEASMARVAARGARCAVAERFWDVDEVADLERLRAALERDPALAPSSRAALARLELA